MIIGEEKISTKIIVIQHINFFYNPIKLNKHYIFHSILNTTTNLSVF